MSNEWQPIETAPKNGQPVILWDGVFVWVGSYGLENAYEGFPWTVFDPDQDDLRNGLRDDKRGPSYWMPLPEPPIT